MAPGAAIAASIPSGAAFAGGALPLAVIVALVACLFTALSVAELAKHLPAAGSVATYTSRGLHPAIGFLVAWGYLFVEALVPTLLLLQLGFTVASTFNGYPQGLWWPWALLGAVIVGVAGFWGARVSATMGTILGAFEILVFLILAVLLIVKAGGSNTLSVFTSAHTPAAHLGFAGVIAGSVYTVLAFSGFEAAAPLAEEAKNPRKTVRRAVVGATLGIGAVYIFTTYAAAVFVGPDRFGSFGTTGALSWEGIAKASFGIFWIFVFLAIVNSTIANANAGMNVSTRTAFALSRIGVLPKALSRVHPVHRSPVVAVGVQFAVAVIATLALGFAFTPTTAFVLVATIIVVVVVSVYIIVNAACIGFFLRFKRAEFNWFLHLVSPILGIVVFVPALLTSAGIPVFSFVATLSPPVSYAGLIVGVWMVLGIAYLVYLWGRHRQRVMDTGLVHLDDETEPEAEAPVELPS
jgi:amino acid transporter